jgi:glyoxylase-like metal-dependent hydrolase (beta-lactamase superfamily II)
MQMGWRTLELETSHMTELTIHQFFCRSDNFGVLIHDNEYNLTASIDTPDAAPIRQALHERGWNLTHILTTHHHGDHTAGHAELKRETGCAAWNRSRRGRKRTAESERLSTPAARPFTHRAAE